MSRGMSRTYRFTGTWRVPFPPDRVQPVLVDLEHYPEWWPQVRAVAKITDDDARVLCRSVLPYTLDLLLHADRREPRVLETSLAGDLEGFARWDLADDGAGTRMDYAQEVRVAGRVLAAASYPLRPLLRWNHHRMMTGCVEGLTARLLSPPLD
jgi:hypothetical protein